MPRDFSSVPPAALKTGFTDTHDFGGIWPLLAQTTSVYTPTVKNLNGYISVAFNNNSLGNSNFLCTRDGSLSPLVPLAQGAITGNPNWGLVHSDVWIVGSSSAATLYGLNLRQGGVARNLNNTAALAGIIPIGASSTSGYGLVSLGNGVASNNICLEHYPDDRYLIGASSENTTYYGSGSVVAAPSAPTLNANNNTGGYITAATGDLTITTAWITRRNTRCTGQGITTESAALTVTPAAGGTGTNGSVVINIAAAPTGATAYVVYAGQGGGTRYVVGGGIALAAGTTHTIKTTMTKQAMANLFFHCTSAQVNKTTVGTIENASPLTLGTPRSFSTYHNGLLWSPFFKDPSQLFCLNAQPVNANVQLKADLYDIQAGTIATNQTTTADGQPCIISTTSTPFSDYIYYRSIPELMAYAIGGVRFTSLGALNASKEVSYLIIRSCMTNEILTTVMHVDTSAYTNSFSSTLYNGIADFEAASEDTGATKSVDVLMPSMKHRAILRQPVVWRS